MSKFLSIVIILALVAISSAVYLHPWNNQTWIATNPNIEFYGIWYWWNLPALHATLESLDTAGSTTLDLPSEVKADTDAAAESYLEASDRKNLCILSLELAGYVTPPSSLEYFVAFSDISGCRSYEHSWKSSVSSALSAAEKSLSQSRDSIQRARDAYDEIVFMGLCEGNYSEDGSEKCPELRSAFTTVENNLTEGRYGKYSILVNHGESLKRDLHDPAPDLSSLSLMLGLAFGDSGVIATFDSVRGDVVSVKARSEATFTRLLDSASIKKAESEKRLDELDSQKIFLIDEAPSGYEVRDVGSIQERFVDISEEKDQADLILAEARSTKSRTNQPGFMASTVELMSQADASYLDVLGNAEDLKFDAESSVLQMKESAEKEIADTKRSFASIPGSTDAMQILEDAESALKKGDGTTILGIRFKYYSQAAALARTARDANTMEMEAAASSTLALLEELISKAEKDGIAMAEERELLRLASSLPPIQAEEASQATIEAIILKARTRYESDILSSRGRIYDKLSLAGSDAADLYTDMENLESGLITNGAIVFPQAIGSLSNLLEGYTTIEDELGHYLGTIVGNAMAADVTPLIGPVVLDGPSDITVDAVLTNPRPYGAKTVSVPIHTGASFNLLYSDITKGKSDVVSVREGEDGIILLFSEVLPYDNKRVVLEKHEVIARTIKRTTIANGLGNGRAMVSEQIEFELDFNVPSLQVPDGCDEALVDGLPPERHLEKGDHVLTCESFVTDAYDETMANFRSYQITVTSRVEYDIHISPNIDLDTVPIVIDGQDDSAISKLKITPVSGASIEDQSRISDTQYSATVTSLEKGVTAILRVSYTVDDTATYIQSQLAMLRSANLSTTAEDLVTQAEWQAGASNYSKALELLSQAAAMSKADEKTNSKLREKREELIDKLRDEITEIDSALSLSLSNSTFTEKLHTRRAELSRTIEDAQNQDLEEAVQILGKLDLKWLSKELTSFRKESYKSYNDLKERFYLAGNSTTPEEFLNYEDALQKLGAGGRLEYAIEAAEALATVERLVIIQEQSKSSVDSQLKYALESLESETLAVFDHYSHEASAAKGTDYSSFFTISQSKIERTVKDAKNALEKDSQSALPKIDELNQTKGKMTATLESLALEADAKISILSSLIDKKENDDERTELRSKLESIRQQAASREYVNSLRAGSTLAKELESNTAPAHDGLIVLGLTAMAMAAAAGFYMFKQQKPKELKKLPSLSDKLTKPAPKKPTSGTASGAQPRQPGSSKP